MLATRAKIPDDGFEPGLLDAARSTNDRYFSLGRDVHQLERLWAFEKCALIAGLD